MAALEGGAPGGACGEPPPPGQQEEVAKNSKVGWTKEEDDLLRELVREHGNRDWNFISRMMIPAAGRRRSGKSCRNRWTQHLDPSVNAAHPFTAGEDDRIVELHRVHGNRWATIASFLPGRTDNAVKNRFNTHLRKRLGGASGGEMPTPVCLPLFPLTPGFHHQKQALPPLAGPERSGAVPECLELFPLAPGDLRDNASAEAAAAMDVDSEADRSLTELRLAPPAAVVFDAIPLHPLPM